MNKKILAVSLLLTLLCIIFALTNTVSAASGDYGKVSIITGTGDVTNEQAQDVVVTFTDTQLKWVEADSAVGRNEDGYWIGIKVEKPTTTTIDENASTIDGIDTNGNITSHFVYGEIKDSETYTTLYKRVTEEILNSNKEEMTFYTYKCYWKTSAEAEPTVQTITLKVKKGAVKLEKEGTVTVTVGEHKFTLSKGKTLADLTDSEKAVLNTCKVAPAGKIFSHFVNEEGKKVSESDVISADVTLKPVFVADQNYVEATDEDKETDKTKEKDNSPKTGVTSLAVMTVALVSLAGIIATKKSKK